MVPDSQYQFGTTDALLAYGNLDSAGNSDASANTSITARREGCGPQTTFFLSHDSGLCRGRHAELLFGQRELDDQS
ncbi:MAG: hypothetical protein PVF75_07055 [Granulosicoccaceae bacterium]|jgi:hypothetical protein